MNLKYWRKQTASFLPFFFAKDWIRYQLTGESWLEIRDTGTSLLDLQRGELSNEVLSQLGIGAVNHGDVYTILGSTCCTGIVCNDLKRINRQTRFVPHALYRIPYQNQYRRHTNGQMPLDNALRGAHHQVE